MGALQVWSDTLAHDDCRFWGSDISVAIARLWPYGFIDWSTIMACIGVSTAKLNR